ncbi:hypothetical protein JXB27_01130 [Candidatus Woesearchaeota archaeon]|nr:hypothetical protein [Candidatus Woesearchaeota archaeon]
MAITIEEIWKLPPKERLAALRAFQEEQKKIHEERKRHHEEEEKKTKEETEEILKKSIDELAFAEEEEQLKERIELERTEKKKENLEEIAGEAKTKRESAREEVAYQSRLSQEARIRDLAKVAASNIYGSLKEIQEAQLTKGYLNPEELTKVHNFGEALYQKQKSEYAANEESKRFMSKAEELVEEMSNPLKRKYR